MNYEEKYWELWRERNRTAKAWLANPDSDGDEYREYVEARAKFANLCAEILEILMKENVDVLKRLS